MNTARLNVAAEVGAHLSGIDLDRFHALMDGDAPTPDESARLEAMEQAADLVRQKLHAGSKTVTK